MKNYFFQIKVNLKNLFIFVQNTLIALPYILSKNNLKYFPRYPSFWLPVCIKINRNQIIGYSSINKKAAGKMNCVCRNGIDIKEITPIKNLFTTNPKYITALQVLQNKEVDIFNLSEFKFYENILNNGGKPRGMKSISEIEMHLSEIIKFYNAFKRDGYKKKYRNYLDFNSEMQFMYLGDGKFIKVNSGNHRFAAIEILNIKNFYGHIIAFDENYLFNLGKDRGYKILYRIWRDFIK